MDSGLKAKSPTDCIKSILIIPQTPVVRKFTFGEGNPELLIVNFHCKINHYLVPVKVHTRVI